MKQSTLTDILERLADITRGSLVSFDSTSDTLDKLDGLMQAVVDAGLVNIDNESGD